MKINFLGDSITAGAGAERVENMFSTLLAGMLNAEEKNYGVCGTRIARQTLSSDDPAMDETFLDRERKMDRDADLVLVFGGTNDYGHGDALMGDMSSESEYTFYGAMKQLVEALIRDFGREKVIFILPLPRYDQDNVLGENEVKMGSVFPLSRHDKDHPVEALYPLSAYIQAEKDVLEHYQVRYLDLSGDFHVPTTNAGDELTMDGLHPNIAGHRYLADVICAKL